MNKVREFVLDALQREYSFKKNVDVNTINYIEEGYMNSLGLVLFIAELEEEFGIEFTEEELSSSEFRTIGSLIAMVEYKIDHKAGK